MYSISFHIVLIVYLVLMKQRLEIDLFFIFYLRNSFFLYNFYTKSKLAKGNLASEVKKFLCKNYRICFQY